MGIIIVASGFMDVGETMMATARDDIKSNQSTKSDKQTEVASLARNK